MIHNTLSRKNFLKLVGTGLLGLGISPKLNFSPSSEFPNYERLGRVCIGMVEIKAEPYIGSRTVDILYEDAVIPWIRDIVAKEFNLAFYNQRWVETLNGFIFAPHIQPVKNLPNQPINSLIASSLGEGMWAEVTVPYADVTLVTNPSSNSWVSQRIESGLPLRVYYGQVYYIDRIKKDNNGSVYYRANPNYWGGLDMFWVPAEAMHPISPEELTPIHPEIEDKKIIIDVARQTLSCLENNKEIYYCLISSGGKYNSDGVPVDKWSTPLGSFLISRKYISLQMSGGTTGAPYDLPGIGWVSMFATGGVAIHATIWHNDFGADPMSHGCVNALPEDAKWIFRWSLPHIQYDPGMVDISISGDPSTRVNVIES